MATIPVTIELDSEVADAFNKASDEDRRKMQVLLSLWLREYATSPPVSLSTVMDRISHQAQARGLTPEILESLLNDE